MDFMFSDFSPILGASGAIFSIAFIDVKMYKILPVNKNCDYF